MAKNLISRLSVLAVLIVFMAACSKKSEYTNAIPADATAIAAIHLKTFADKAGLNDKENEATKKKMMDALKSGTNAATFQQLEKIMQDPSKSGIDVQSPIYAFSAVSFPYYTLAARVSSQENLRASLDIMAKEQICQPIAEADGYSFTTLNNSSLLAFNATTALLVQTEGATQMEEAKKVITNLLKQTAENSINKNKAFEKMQKQKGEITFLASIGDVPLECSSFLTSILPSNIHPKDVMLQGSLHFEKGKIALQFNYYSDNKEVDAMLKKNEKALMRLSTNSLKYFPASTLAFLNIGANGSEFYNLLLSNQEFTNNFTIARAEAVKDLFSAFNGDIAIGLLNVSMKENATSFLAYADVTNGNALKTFYTNKKTLKLKKGYDILQLGANEYVYKTREMNLFFGVKDRLAYATNDELLYKNVGKTIDKSIKDTRYASEMKDKNVFAAINVEAILELPIIKMLIGLGNEENQMYYSLASQIDYLEMGIKKDGEGKISLVLKKEDTNALKQIADFAKQFAGL
ncbi:MAG: DUF4836 family protein [Bacteroides sp.]